LGWNFPTAKLDCERPAGNRAGHTFGKWYRRAALQRLHDGDAVLQPVVIGGLLRFKGNPGMAKDLTGPVEADNHGDVDTGIGA